MAKKVYTDLSFQGGAKVTGLPNPTLASDAVPLSYLQGQMEGLSWKDSCRVATTASLTLTAPGSSIDGITLTQGDRVLVKDQGTGSQNGIYVFDTPSTAMTRAADASVFAELEAAIVVIEEGSTNGGTTWRQTAVNGVIGTDTVTFTAFGSTTPNASDTVAGKVEVATQAETDAGTAVGGTGALLVVTPATLASWPKQAKRYAATIGDGVSASFNVTHSLGTTDVTVSVFEVATGAEVMTDISRTNANTVQVSFINSPASNSHRVVVIG